MRKKLEVTQPEANNDQLKELVDLYGQKKDEESLIKKETSKQNLILKELLKKQVQIQDEKYVFSGDKYTVTLSVEDSSTINEERLIEFLKQKLSKSKIKSLGIIKTKEYVDENAIEAAIYTGAIPAEVLTEMESCKDKSTKEVLRIAKKKGE